MESDAVLLEKLKLFETSYLKRAAIMLFHEDAERVVTGGYVKVGYFRTDSDLLYHDEIHGGLFSQVEKTVNLLLTRTGDRTLTAKHASAPYNPDIASAFFRVAFMEAWGRGIDLIRNACHAHGSPEPQFRWDNGL